MLQYVYLTVKTAKLQYSYSALNSELILELDIKMKSKNFLELDSKF